MMDFHFSRSAVSRHALAVVSLCLLLAGVSRPAAAENYGDMTITATPMPHAQTTHGYAEHRVTLVNHSGDKTHVVDLTLPAENYGGLTLSRRIVVPPRATMQASLWQPAVEMYSDAMRVAIDGQKQKKTITTLNAGHGAPSSYGWRGGASTFVLVSRTVDSATRDRLEKTLETLATSTTAAGGSYTAYHGGYATAAGDPAVQLVRAETQAVDWSDNWLGFSRYDGLILTPRDLQTMSPATRDALWAYAEAGGVVLTLGEVEPPAAWRNTRRKKNENGQAYTAYEVGFGTLIVIADATDARQWKEEQVRWLVEGLNGATRLWSNSIDVRQANDLFPVVDHLQIPVRGMLVLMIVFALLVGPVNLFVLGRMKKRLWSLATVPALSLVFSVTVLGYALLAEGISPTGRAATITVLDEGAHRATTIGWLGYYAPLTPSGGLHFDTTTELTPLVATNHWSREMVARHIDWTRDQHLVSGWAAARVPAHFMVRKCAVQRERLSVTRDEAGNLAVVNGLGGDIKQLTLADHDGALFRGEAIAAGQKATLTHIGKLSNTADRRDTALNELYFENPWLDAVKKLSAPVPEKWMRPGVYVAVLADAPFVEPGMAGMREFKAESVVYGVMPPKGEAQ